MNLSRFFIDRPIAAIVLSLAIVIAGLLSVGQLPLTEYPRVTPPTVVVRAAYPGANPQVIATTVAAPLEQEINGVEGMLYMSSQASSDGTLTLTVTFEPDVDPDIAQVAVQNRVSRAVPRLPEEVQRLGITTEKSSPDMLMVVHLVSPGDERDPLYLSNYATLRLRDEIARIPGVGSVITRGWADPQNHRTLTDSEPLVPGEFRELTFNLQPDDQVIPAGRRIAVMIFSSDRDFTLWPEPGTELTVDLDGTSLTIPVVGGEAALRRAFGPTTD